MTLLVVDGDSGKQFLKFFFSGKRYCFSSSSVDDDSKLYLMFCNIRRIRKNLPDGRSVLCSISCSLFVIFRAKYSSVVEDHIALTLAVGMLMKTLSSPHA